MIEVITRDAIGSQLIARATGDSLPSFGVSGTARVALAKHLALRAEPAKTAFDERSRRGHRAERRSKEQLESGTAPCRTKLTWADRLIQH